MHKQLRLFFLYSLLIWSTGNGLMSLLPVYALQLGAPPTIVSRMLASTYLALAIGTILTPPLLARVQSTTWIVIGTLMPPIPALLLLSVVESVWQLGALIAVVWLCAGLGLAVVTIATARRAGGSERGRLFGLMFVAMPLGSVLGGATLGAAVERWGFPVTFGLLGGVWLGMLALLAARLEPDRSVQQDDATDSRTATAWRGLGLAALFLLGATLIKSTAFFVARLVFAVAMHNLGFGPLSIASTAIVGGIATLPMPWLAGLLSDRFGRRRLAYGAYSLALGGLLLLADATQLHQFLLAAALISIAGHAGSTVAAALMTDLTMDRTPPSALSLLSAMPWLGAILGFGVGGSVLEMIGGARCRSAWRACFWLRWS